MARKSNQIFKTSPPPNSQQKIRKLISSKLSRAETLNFFFLRKFCHSVATFGEFLASTFWGFVSTTRRREEDRPRRRAPTDSKWMSAAPTPPSCTATTTGPQKENNHKKKKLLSCFFFQNEKNKHRRPTRDFPTISDHFDLLQEILFENLNKLARQNGPIRRFVGVKKIAKKFKKYLLIIHLILTNFSEFLLIFFEFSRIYFNSFNIKLVKKIFKKFRKILKIFKNESYNLIWILNIFPDFSLIFLHSFAYICIN